MNENQTNNEVNEHKSLTAKETALLLSDALTGLKKRRISARYARAISQIAGNLVKVVETAYLEERIAEIEKRMDERDKRMKERR